MPGEPAALLEPDRGTVFAEILVRVSALSRFPSIAEHGGSACPPDAIHDFRAAFAADAPPCGYTLRLRKWEPRRARAAISHEV
jgi:hypothetical protein